MLEIARLYFAVCSFGFVVCCCLLFVVFFFAARCLFLFFAVEVVGSLFAYLFVVFVFNSNVSGLQLIGLMRFFVGIAFVFPSLDSGDLSGFWRPILTLCE